MTESPAQIDAAVEQVVRSAGDPVALETSVRELTGLLGWELVAKADDPAAMLVHAKFGGHHEQHGGHDEYVTPQPRHGEHGTCAECGAAIEYFDCPDAPYWRHVAHPSHCHDAELGGPA